MYSLEQLQQKTFRQLKEIGWELNVLPEGDRRCRQNWIDVIVGVNPPLLELLETSPGVEVEPVEEAIEVQATELIESKFGRIVYRQPAQKPIAPAAEKSLDVDRESPGLTAADAWNPNEFGEVLHKVEASGQLNLLEWEDKNEPPDPDDYGSIEDFRRAYDIWELENCVQGAGAIDLQLHDRYIRQSNSGENNHGESSGTDTEPVGADEIAIATELPSGCDCCAKLHGTGSHNQNEGLGSQKGDRLLEESGPDSGDTGGVLSHQPPELVSDAILDYLRATGHKIAPNITPQAAFNDEQPPNRGDDRKSGKLLAIGMQVGRRSDRQHAGTILDIYRSKRGKLRAKIQPLNKSNFVYFDYDNLVEQKLVYDYQMKPGGFVETGSSFDKKRGEHFEVWTRKPSARKAAENWTIDELAAKPIWQLKAIAKRCCEIIPGGHPRTKRAYIRAILAEQELRAIVIEKEPLAPKPELERTPLLRVQNSAPAKSKKRAKTAQTPEPLGQQLSLNFSVA